VIANALCTLHLPKAGIALAGPVTVADLLPLLPSDAAKTTWRSAGSPLMTTLVHEYRRRGIALTVFTNDQALEGSSVPWVRWVGDGLTLYVTPRRAHAYRWQHGRPGRIVDFFALERAGLRAAMVHAQPRLVHAHWSYEYAWAAQQAGLPSLVTCHDSPTAILRQMPDAYRIARWCMARHVLRRADAVSVVSPYLTTELRRWLSCEPTVVPNPLPAAAFVPDDGRQAERRASTWPLVAPRVGMVLNGWGTRKNPQPGMLAMSRLRAVWPQAELHLIGPDFGPGEAAQRWAAQHGLAEAFQFHGRLGHAATLVRIAAFDLLIHPALEESFGLSIAEAMALGVPVVAGRSSGAVPWVMGAAAGALVDVRSADQILAAAQRLLGDAAAHQTAACAGRQRALQVFSAQAVADQYLGLYAAVLPGAVPAQQGVLA
jgi:glycosyltransferase involved in cell wall biosynthesis